jgi:hypothetical protein
MDPLLAEHLASTYFDEYLALRGQLTAALDDADLATSLGGSTLTLGALCREIGEIEMSYIEGLRTFRQRFDHRHDDDRVEHEVAALAAWYDELDRDLHGAIDGLTETDIRTRRILRSDFDESFFSPMATQALDIYREALLIFYGKATVYLRALDRPLPGNWDDWIG